MIEIINLVLVIVNIAISLVKQYINTIQSRHQHEMEQSRTDAAALASLRRMVSPPEARLDIT